MTRGEGSEGRVLLDDSEHSSWLKRSLRSRLCGLDPPLLRISFGVTVHGRAAHLSNQTELDRASQSIGHDADMVSSRLLRAAADWPCLCADERLCELARTFTHDRVLIVDVGGGSEGASKTRDLRHSLLDIS